MHNTRQSATTGPAALRVEGYCGVKRSSYTGLWRNAEAHAHVLPPAQWRAGERIGPCDMVANLIEEQGREWLALYSQIRALLQQFGKEDDSSGEKDYLLVSDNLGLWQHRIETSNLAMVKPVVIKSLQKR